VLAVSCGHHVPEVPSPVKDGKEHRVLEHRREAVVRRRARGRSAPPVPREINDSQQAPGCAALRRSRRHSAAAPPGPLPRDRAVPAHAADVGIQLRLREFTLERPRQWGACWVVCQLWAELQLERFWRERLPDSREGTSWYHLLLVLVAYRSSTRAASGGVTASGIRAARWGICSAKMRP